MDIFTLKNNGQLNDIAKQTNGVYAYNLDNGLRGWRLAKARLDAGIAETINLNIVGDSITEGYFGTTISIENYLKGYANLARMQLATKYGDVGKGWIGNTYPYGGAVGAWTYTGTWQNYGYYGWMYGVQGIKASTTAGNTASLSFTGTGVTVLIESSASGGNFTISIDGGGGVTYSSYNATKIVKEIAITGLSNASHSLVITTQANTLSLLGAYEIKGTTGVRVNTMAVSGAMINHLTQNDFNLDACIGYWQPKLTIISFMANDYNNQTALADYITRWQSAITKAKTYGSVLVTSTGGIYNATKTIPMSKYKEALFKLAMDNDVAFLDTSKRWGDSYTKATGYIADECHPKPEGHQDIANAILKVILED